MAIGAVLSLKGRRIKEFGILNNQQFYIFLVYGSIKVELKALLKCQSFSNYRV